MPCRRIDCLLLSLALLSGILAMGVFGGCKSQVRVPDDALQPRTDGGAPTFSAENLADNMVLVHTPQRSFFIDPFEVSQLGTGDHLGVRNQKPLVAVEPAEAARICAATGKRLCTRLEWTNACLGTYGRRYSYGDQYVEDRCRTQSDEHGIAGDRGECRTDTGIYDMIGNVMEWVADTRGGMAVAVGGSYLSGQEADCFTRYYFPNGHKHEQIGFRCCRDVR